MRQLLTDEQAVTREKESEVHELQQQVSAIVWVSTVVLHSHQLAEKELKAHQLQQELQAVTKEKENEVHELQQQVSAIVWVNTVVLHSHQLAEKELKAHQLQQELTHEQAVTREKENEVHELQQQVSAIVWVNTVVLHSHQLAEKELKAHQLQQELTHEQAVTREKENEVHKLQQQVSAIVWVNTVVLHSHQLAEKELQAHQLQQQLSCEQAKSRLAHEDLLAVEIRDEKSQQLSIVLKEEVCEHKVDIDSCTVFMFTID